MSPCIVKVLMTKYTILKKIFLTGVISLKRSIKNNKNRNLSLARSLRSLEREESAEENLNTKKMKGFKPFSVASSEAGERHWFF